MVYSILPFLINWTVNRALILILLSFHKKIKQKMIPQWLDIDTQNTAEGIGFFFFTSGIKKSNWIKYNINQNKIFCSIYFWRPKLKKFRTLPLLCQKCFKVPRKLKILLKYGMLTRFHHPDRDPRYWAKPDFDMS